jgi:hypothetical protein
MFLANHSGPLRMRSARMSERPFLGMRVWAETRFGKPAERITTSDVERVLPRRDDLPEPPFEDPLGGRVRFRLKRWPTVEEAQELGRRAQHFLDNTPRT